MPVPFLCDCCGLVVPTFFVMDMASVHALQACNIACYDKISETMLAAASSSGAGVVLVMDVDEDGKANKIFEVTVFESDG